MAQAVVAIVVFAGLVASALWCATRRTAASAFVLAAFGGLWLVANNNVFEGPILLSLDDKHGLTLMDLFSYVGGLAAVLVQLIGRPVVPAGQPSARRRLIATRVAFAVVCAALVAAGLATSYFYQPNG